MFQPGKSYKHSKTIKLNYESQGDGDIVLVFLPGFGDSLRVWDDVRQHLSAEKYTSYFLELKGFGFSSKPGASDYQIQAQARLVLDFVQAMGVAKFVLIGHSYGGSVALVLAVQNWAPRAIQKLILINTPAYADQIPLFIHSLRIPLLSPLIWRLLPHSAKAWTVMRTAMYDQTRISAERVHKRAFFYGLDDSFTGLSRAAQHVVPDNLDQLIDQYKQLHVPTLIIWGEEDRIISVKQAHALADLLPHAQLKLIPACGHASHEEQPQVVLNHITCFVDGA